MEDRIGEGNLSLSSDPSLDDECAGVGCRPPIVIPCHDTGSSL
jgi:hypothetical protein